MVLLTLGIAAYVEQTVRQKMAKMFDACVLVKPCTECSHRHKNCNVLVIAFNFGFRILAMLHLAYLGIVMNDGFVEQSKIGAPMQMIHERWNTLNYLGHWIILLTFSITAVI